MFAKSPHVQNMSKEVRKPRTNIHCGMNCYSGVTTSGGSGLVLLNKI